MKHLILVPLFLVAVAGCANSPTAPSSVAGVVATSETLTSHKGQSRDGQKLSLFFFSDDIINRGNVHIVGLPVTVVAGAQTLTLYTDAQGRVTFTIPETITSIVVTTAAYQGFCPTATTLSLPFRQRVAFINVDNHGC
jgi:hypothetical protein